jgi:hypothetical protein
VLGYRDARAGEIERRVAVRMKRQELLAAADPPRLWAVLDEAALRRPVGGHDAGGTFTILRFAERDVADVVYVEQLTGATYVDKPDALDYHRDVMNRLACAALAPAATADLLAGMLREI